MPELPEVETVRRDLVPLVAGRTIVKVHRGPHQLRSPWQPRWSQALRSQTITGIHRRGKYLLVGFAEGFDRVLQLHLGMTGQLTVHGTSEEQANHVHLRWEFDDDRELRFRDPRRFGSATLLTPQEHLAFASALGPEPFNLDAAWFQAMMMKSKRCLKAVLLDQGLLAGVGNIYADESCFRAGLHPARLACTLSATEADRLRIAIDDVLTAAVNGRGSTIRDYIGGSGLRGTFQSEFAVYGRDGEACPRCGTIIAVERLAGRSSHYCAECQPRDGSASPGSRQL